MFNLKTAAKAEETNEIRLKKQRDSLDVSLPEVTGNLNDLLSEEHSEVFDKTSEAQLEKKRTGIIDRTTDGQLGHHKSPEGFVPTRADTEKTVHQGLPINNLAEAREQEHIKAYDKAAAKQSNTELWDTLIGEQLDGKKTTQVGNKSHSQLQNKSERFTGLTEEKATDNKKVKEMVMASMKDADAMLFHIYHKSSVENRQLNEEEKKLVNGINSDKAKILETLGY